MSRTEILIEAVLEDTWFTLDELCRAAAVTPQWMRDRIDEGLLPAPAGAPRHWRFDAAAVQRVRRVGRIERDFDASPELAALVADLIDEIERLRAQLARAGME